ncbi:CPBP family intramembrane metalloprotease [Bacillus sp. BRMEA1]|uniref:CPBP family intramembrane glutamic endopeptidase n=1 Tax=Neobacillus endophyticus TaxID=2738405 RepID=UPI001566F9E7|nr:CPBP family intramembrane glutamic endopeptidase [Neobacillus endophyticus]NRD78981.1 CPBP family intramembrane metalloprotease [Neobacillus endophyticus]
MKSYGKVIGLIVSVSVLVAIGIIIILMLIHLALQNMHGGQVKIDKMMDNEWSFDIAGFVQEFITISIVLLFWTKVNKRKISEIGLRDDKFKSNFLKGVALGLLAMTVIFLVLLSLGAIHVTSGNSDIIKIVVGFILMFFVGFTEEFMFRGYILQTLLENRPKWEAIIVSSLIFGAIHISNDNANTIGIINVMLGGLLFSLMYIKTGSIWLGVGFHFMWDFAISYLYGFADSGNVTSGFLKSIPVKAQQLFNGGAFGAEGGLVFSLGVLTLIIYFLRKNKKTCVLKNTKIRIL